MGWRRLAMILALLTCGCGGESIHVGSQAPAAAEDPRAAAESAESPGQDPNAAAREGQSAGPSPTVVYLDKSDREADGVRNLARSGLLSGELVRQAFLIAAREELGLVARDARLGDPMPTGGDNPPFVIAAEKEQKKRQELWRGFAGKRTSIGKYVVESPFHKAGYPKTCTSMEKMSRGKFVEFLREAGFAGEPIPTTDAGVPESIEKLLSEMTFTSQFSAVRQLHALAHDEGTSDARLGALVRGYANLGCLTEFYWHPAHKVFKARTTLYAERLLARKPKAPWGSWHRAYAYALAGLPKQARADLDAARSAWEALPETDRPQRPDWADLLDAHCRYEPEEIVPEAVDKNDRQLAFLMRYLAVERAGYWPATEKVALETVEEIPECYRVYDDLCQFGGVGVGHRVTLAGLSRFGQAGYQRLLAMPDLPEPIKKIAQGGSGNPMMKLLLGRGGAGADRRDEFGKRKALIEALLDAKLNDGDSTAAESRPAKPTSRGEPSWATLGLLIRELTFAQVEQRAQFESRKWGVSPDEFLAASAPLVEMHPYRPYIDRYAWDKPRRDRAWKELVDVPLEDPEMRASGIYDAVKRLSTKKAERVWRQMSAHFDCTVFDFVRAGMTEAIPSDYCGEGLLAVDPMSPFARALSVGFNWDKIEDRAADWEKDGAKFPRLMLAFGYRYYELKRYEDAARCYKAAVEACPSLDACRALAAVYWAEGKMDLWLATLEAYLKEPDYGLGHAKVQEQIAYEFMGRGEYQRALPYAEGAAECYSGWGLKCAARCHEGLRNWKEAEAYFRNIAERYRGSTFDWYFFCRRTGKGNVGAARQCVEDALADPSTRAVLDGGAVAFFFLLEGRHEEALAGFQKCFQNCLDPYFGLCVALLADQLGRADLRDQALKKIETDGKQYINQATGRPFEELIALAALLTGDLANGGKGEIDAAALEKLCPKDNARTAVDVQCFAAGYLDLHGQSDLALDYWKRCLTVWLPDRWNYILAEIEMLARGHAAAEFGPTLKEENEAGVLPKEDAGKAPVQDSEDDTP